MTPEQMQEMAKSLGPLVASHLMDHAKGQRDGYASLLGGNAAEPLASTPSRAPVTGKHMTEGTGINLIRFVKAKAVARMDGRNVVDVLKGWGDEVVSKALSQGNYSGLGSMVHPQFASEFIDLLRHKAVVRQAGARVIPIGASLTFDRQSSTGTAFYGGETSTIQESEPGTDAVSLSEKKLTALTAVPNDLIRNASINAEEFVRNDLLNVMALREDLAFLRGTGTQLEPRGIRNQIDPANVYAETVATAGAATLGEMKKELNKAKKKLKKGNVPMLTPVWLMSPNAETAILDSVGPGGEGTNSLEKEMVERGTLRNVPFFVTNQIPETLGAGNSRSELYLVDMSEVLIGESMALEIDVFPNGAFTRGGQVVSGISTDQTVLRAITKHDLAMRHRQSGIVVKDLSWGNS
ncbi:phage major capsid protein [Myxococcus sp. AM011]|uniref:phage major capsid protein n=1 Tax=Myxococcus sp. AM011 TaxID=2745200 RepID=UPI001595007A|nr:phage major capsid protein [Myxococcus sp. AM011]NVJ20644.1 phage major capsid protein [Myxococcus sp. AM011]